MNNRWCIFFHKSQKLTSKDPPLVPEASLFGCTDCRQTLVQLYLWSGVCLVCGSCLRVTLRVSWSTHFRGSRRLQRASTSAVARWWHFEKERNLLMFSPLCKNSWIWVVRRRCSCQLFVCGHAAEIFGSAAGRIATMQRASVSSATQTDKYILFIY